MTRSRSTTVVATAIAAIAASALTATTTHAQDAVQWRVEDGGNGHWYVVMSVPETCFDEIRAIALTLGGDLASVESSEENEFVRQRLESLDFIPDRCVLGLVPFEGESEDDPSNWYWIDGSPGSFRNWNTSSQEPGDYPGTLYEPIASIELGIDGVWSDVPCGGPNVFTAAIEWSADCNGDGIVDYGQILDGTFADENGNGVPDLCDPVQWRVEDGGNGHWYQIVDVEPASSLGEAIAAFQDDSNHPASIRSQSENDFVFGLRDWNCVSPEQRLFFGLGQDPEAPDYEEPAGGWYWLEDGTPLAWENWNSNSPSDLPDVRENAAHMILCGPDAGQWNDTSDDVLNYPDPFQFDYLAVLEWSADCNGDGIVDYGQIVDGTFADEDGNGVPDCCDDATCLAPIQWRVEDGGNGHWYQGLAFIDTPGGIDWNTARAEALTRGGDLTSLETTSELVWVYDEIASAPGMWWFNDDENDGPYVGGFQDCDSPECEPGGGWTWLTGTPITGITWGEGAPNNAGSLQDHLHFWVNGPGIAMTFDDVADIDSGGSRSLVIEWSADCNGDGIVDYGQILDGTFADVDGDGVPDVCDAVQWRVEDGGNGHWYNVIRFSEETDWYAAADAANAIGGHLATATNAPEALLLKDLAGNPAGWLNRAGPWVGGFQNTSSPEYAEPSGGWEWITGEEWFPVWEDDTDEPNDNGGDEDFLNFVADAGDDCDPDLATRTWNDLTLTRSGDNCLPTPISMLIEWSADCNGDGIVDYGQILDGTVADCDGNGVPDECDLNAVFAETQPGTPAGPTDYLTFDVSSLPDARDTVTIEVSALGELAGPARFLFVYLDEPTVENRIGIVFGGGGENCLGLVETLEMPVGGWNDAGLDGSRSIIIAGSGLDPICGEDAYTGINVMVPIDFTDCDDDGVWDACTIADGTTPDADGDGTVDACDQCPTDPEKIDPGVCGCGVADLDTDGDGLADCVDPCPNWPYECSEDGQTIVVAADQSIQLAIDVIPVGGTIELAPTTYLPPATLDPNGRDFTLRGAVDPEGTPLTVIDGQNAIRILAIDGGETAALLIENLVIRNGYSGGGPEDVGGGVLIFNADATIDNCIFEDNTGTNYGGALAIHNDDFVSDTTVSNCIFRNNTAVDGAQPSGIGGRGGAVSVYRGNPVITGCIFEGNLAQDEGGAIHDNSGAPSVSMCEFDGNTASDDGGAMYLFQSTASFVECDFTGSVAEYGGGAVFHDGGAPSYRECTFDSNSSTNYYGGGMFNYSSTPTVSECLFVGNTALSGDAGGMYNFNGSDAILTNCTFRNNQSGSGGGIRNNNSSPTLTGCVFDRNSASSGGGGIYCDVGSTPTLTKCVFLNNTAPNGGGIQAVDGSDLVIQDSTFEDNTASTNGGGIQVDSSAPTIIDCVFARNDAGNGGGGLSNFPSGNPIVIRGVFEDNSADTGGGVANSSSSFPSYEGCTFTGNVARGDGSPGAGAIYSNSGSNPSILDSTVCGNLQPGVDQIFGSFTDLGGNCIAEFCDSDKDGVLECDDVCPGEDDFLDTDEDGTPDCLDPCPTWPYDCSEDGETIFVAVGQSIQDALIAVPTGGVVEIAPGTFQIDDGVDGIVLSARDRSIRGSIDGDGEPATILDAGGFGRVMTLSLGLTNAAVIENLVLMNGLQGLGAAANISGQSDPVFRNCRFEGNASTIDGGAIYTVVSEPVFESCRFIGNIAEEEGGAVYAINASLTFVDCEFDGNTALGGGAIVLEASSFNEVADSTFRNNTADRGGAIYLGESDLFLNGSNLIDNAASISGSAVMVYQSTLEIDRTVVCGNLPADQISGPFEDIGGNCIVEDCGTDLDGNDVPDACDPDCDGDGIPDAYEITTGTQIDCDVDGVPDDCGIGDGIALDCNENGIPDDCDIDSGNESDDNANDVPDSCDIASGDLNVDGCIDSEDVGLLLALWGIEGAPVGDLDGDGIVRAGDLGFILAAWRPCDP